LPRFSRLRRTASAITCFFGSNSDKSGRGRVGSDALAER
jgi:hypothetical protein